MKKVAYAGYGFNFTREVIEKLSEKMNERMQLLFMISEQTELSNGGSSELIDKLNRHMTLENIRECYLKYGYPGLVSIKDKIEAKEENEAHGIVSNKAATLSEVLKDVYLIEVCKVIKTDKGNHKKKGKEVKSWERTKFYQK